MRQAVSLWKAVQTATWREDQASAKAASLEDDGSPPYRSFIEEHRPQLRFHYRAIEHLLEQLLIEEAPGTPSSSTPGSSRCWSSTRTSPPTTRPAPCNLLERLDLSPPDGFEFEPRMKRQSDSINDDWIRRYSELRLGTEFDLVPAQGLAAAFGDHFLGPGAGGPGVGRGGQLLDHRCGSSPETRSARVTSSSTVRRLARTAIQTSCRCSALPRYSIASGGRRLDVGDRALDGADDVGDRHLVGRPGQPVAALGAAAGADDAVVLELEQDVLEELQGDVLGLGQALALDRALVGGGQLGGGPHGVVGLG